jgi:hypothetical protein
MGGCSASLGKSCLAVAQESARVVSGTLVSMRHLNFERGVGLIERNFYEPCSPNHCAQARFSSRQRLRWRARNIHQQDALSIADGVRLHYIEKGEDPPVVLLHGKVVTAEDFQTSGVLGLHAPLERRHDVDDIRAG